MKYMCPILISVLLFCVCQLKGQIVEVTELISPSVVSLEVETESGNYTGTGFFIHENGVIATNYHVIEGATKISARTKSGLNLFCKGVLSLDKEKDLALLKFAVKNQPILKLADPAKIKQGEGVVVLGSPKGLDQTVSNGIVSALRDKNGWHTIQVTAPISKGSSGSPVVNMKGEVIGVATFNVVDSQNLNFASSVKHLALMVKSIDNLEVVTLKEAFPDAPKINRPALALDSNQTQKRGSGFFLSTRAVDGIPKEWVDAKGLDVLRYANFIKQLRLKNVTPYMVLYPHFKSEGEVSNSLPPRDMWRNIAATLRVVDHLSDVLEAKPKEFIQAYRSPAYNRVVGGVSKSQHLLNQAVSVQFVGVEPDKVATEVKKLRSEGLFKGGVGNNKSFTEIDTRGYNADW